MCCRSSETSVIELFTFEWFYFHADWRVGRYIDGVKREQMFFPEVYSSFLSSASSVIELSCLVLNCVIVMMFGGLGFITKI